MPNINTSLNTLQSFKNQFISLRNICRKMRKEAKAGRFKDEANAIHNASA